MKRYRNVGHHERVIRVGVGTFLLAWSGFSMFPGWGDLFLMIVGLIALLTGIIGYCPAWQAIGINTCKPKKFDHPSPQPQEPLHGHTDSTTSRS